MVSMFAHELIAGWRTTAPSVSCHLGGKYVVLNLGEEFIRLLLGLNDTPSFSLLSFSF